MLDFEEGSVFSYNYDFGDGWRHTVAVEEFLTLAPSPKQGSCIAGERARPPEDVGGVSGYERFLEIIADKEDPEYTETIRWCGGYFDPEWLDLAVVDKDLRNALRSSNGACTNQNPNPCPRNELDEVQDRRLERNRTNDGSVIFPRRLKTLDDLLAAKHRARVQRRPVVSRSAIALTISKSISARGSIRATSLATLARCQYSLV
ncbi:UNVERIFIED_ORG: hypothetical protein GGI66_005762 [Rhizobium esperanzae]